jgi:hypothetical protein
VPDESIQKFDDDGLEPPRFDHVVEVEDYGDMVVHRAPNGDVVCFHSPLTNGSIGCSICQGGARVYL